MQTSSSDPQLTIIVPVYNGMPFLPETIESLLQQTYQNFRLLVIDDGSTDKSLDYLKTLSDPRLEIRQQKNLGLCESLNRAIKSTASEFIARLDQDDTAMPSRLQEQMDFLTQKPDYGCVLSNITKITESGKQAGTYQMKVSDSIFDYEPEREGCIVHSTICFRRDVVLALGGYRSETYPSDDLDLLLRLWEKSKVAVINKPLVNYRIHSKAATFKTFRTMRFKYRYVIAMSHLRQSGKPEISLAEFTQSLERTHPWTAFVQYIRDTGLLLFRRAGLQIHEGKVVLGMFNLAIAFICHPQLVIIRLTALRKG
jgi:glycosyltransferase involved in cell wall biosynthesis